MTINLDHIDPAGLSPEPPPADGGRRPAPAGAHPWLAVRDARRMRRLVVVMATYVACMALFALVVSVEHANAWGVYDTLLRSAVVNDGAVPEVLTRAVPLALAALAVCIPARAGLVNVGGEGQLIVGAVAAGGVGVALGGAFPGPPGWALMALAGMAFGGLWAVVPALLRIKLGANEAVTTLLMNFVANDVMLYLIYQPWKDPTGGGQPESRPLVGHMVLPDLFGTSFSLSMLVALVVAAAVWALLYRTGWGFALRVVGGNQDAARRAGLPVHKLLASSMLAGGALAGLGGMLNLAGSQLQLVPGGTASYGYIAFLAAFLGRNQPVKVVVAALVFSAIFIGNSGLELSYGLDGNVVDVLLALLVAAPLWLSRGAKEAF
jgi:general nucleoside transport system permease protein